MITILVNLLGIFIIVFIIWWFWLSKPKIRFAKQSDIVEIKVKDGVYHPAYIQAQLNHPITLRFIREDASPCAEVVVFESLNLSKTLPLNQPTDIVLTLKEPGEHIFTCQMGMYQGKILVQ